MVETAELNSDHNHAAFEEPRLNGVTEKSNVEVFDESETRRLYTANAYQSKNQTATTCVIYKERELTALDREGPQQQRFSLCIVSDNFTKFEFCARFTLCI